MSDTDPVTPQEPGAPQEPPIDERPADPAATAESDRIARLRARSAGHAAPSSPTREPTPEPTREPTPEPTPEPTAEPAAPHDDPPPRFATPVSAAPAEAPAPAPAVPLTPYDAPPAADQPRTGATWSASSPRLAVAVATAVLALTGTALAGVVTTHVSSVNAVEGSRADVVGAATSGVATVLSYDYRHLDSDFAAADRLLTPKFRKQYDDTTAKGVKPLAAKYKAISSADVSAAGVVETDADRAVVLVFVNQTVTNSQLTAPRLDRSRIDVTLVRSNGRWLIDKLTTL